MSNMNQKKTFPDPLRYIDGTSAFSIRITPLQSLTKSNVCCLLLTGKRVPVVFDHYVGYWAILH